jgi:hypothetical protein
MKSPKTSVVGLVLIACGAFLIVQAKHVTPEAIAVITSGAGFIAAADSNSKTPSA